MGVEGVVAQNAVAKALAQSAGEVGEAAEHLHWRPAAFVGQTPQQAAGFEDLQNHVGDLHEVVIRLNQFRVCAVRVFEFQAAVLLTVKALVFDVPAMSASFPGDLRLAGLPRLRARPIDDAKLIKEVVVSAVLAATSPGRFSRPNSNPVPIVPPDKFSHRTLAVEWPKSASLDIAGGCSVH